MEHLEAKQKLLDLNAVQSSTEWMIASTEDRVDLLTSDVQERVNESTKCRDESQQSTSLANDQNIRLLNKQRQLTEQTEMTGYSIQQAAQISAESEQHDMPALVTGSSVHRALEDYYGRPFDLPLDQCQTQRKSEDKLQTVLDKPMHKLTKGSAATIIAQRAVMDSSLNLASENVDERVFEITQTAGQTIQLSTETETDQVCILML